MDSNCLSFETNQKMLPPTFEVYYLLALQVVKFHLCIAANANDFLSFERLNGFFQNNY